MTVASLKQMRVRELARMAKQSKIRGWHAMRKDQLVNELVRRATAAKSIVTPMLIKTATKRPGKRAQQVKRKEIRLKKTVENPSLIDQLTSS